jgi:hypothetical protein
VVYFVNIPESSCRTSDTIGKFLPPKTVNVVLCRASDWQSHLYSQQVEGAMEQPGSHLATIARLKKICNSPLLIEGQQAPGRTKVE